jgi:predicted metal-dependent HD superfamily phosphohydrolase
MNYQQLLEKVHDHVITYYKAHNNKNLLYHNLKHTQDVVAAAIQIANHYQLNDDDFFIVLAAVWFHDLGYPTDITSHEERGVELATEYLEKHRVSMENIKLINGCIRATKLPQSASTLLEEIVCDADLFHLGTDDFFRKDKLLLEEYNLLHHTDQSKSEWRLKTISFLESHSYYTEYCGVLLNSTKEKNLEELKLKEARRDNKLIEHPVNNAEQPISSSEPVVPVKKKNKDRPDRGIETMFRISSSNHQRLSDMADKKAHIMITVNSIILSAIISIVLRRLNEYGYLIIPSFILLIVSLLTMIFSILSTRPSIPNGRFSVADIDDQKVNLLFFGNFYKMKLEEFNYGMKKMMEDRDFLYGSLIKDIYAQGAVLGKKYYLLRIAYNMFMFGLIIAMVAFIIASAFFSNNTIR